MAQDVEAEDQSADGERELARDFGAQ